MESGQASWRKPGSSGNEAHERALLIAVEATEDVAKVLDGRRLRVVAVIKRDALCEHLGRPSFTFSTDDGVEFALAEHFQPGEREHFFQTRANRFEIRIGCSISKEMADSGFIWIAQPEWIALVAVSATGDAGADTFSTPKNYLALNV